MSAPPRLFVVLAREAPIGVVLRRGPAPWYHVILWHTSEGKLFRKRGRRTILLADFNGLTPDPQPAPEWATRPLPPLPPRRKSRRAR